MDIKSDHESLIKNLKTLGKFGQIFGTDRGVDSLALTSSNIAARIQVLKWIENVGLEIKIDEIGNIFAVFPDKNGNTHDNVVISGSHIDTVPTGGIYDGRLGVLSVLEAVKALKENNIQCDYPIAIAIFTAEEGSRYQPAMIGSRVFMKIMTVEAAKKIKAHNKDDDSILGDALEKFRTALSKAKQEGALEKDYSTWTSKPFNSTRVFIESHIEQGPILEETGISLAAVTDVLGISQKLLTLDISESNRDPGMTLMEIINQVREIGEGTISEARSTVGMIDFESNKEPLFAITFKIKGVSAHAGACPMSYRQDSAYTAAKIAMEFEKAISRLEGEQEASITYISLTPNTINVVPEKTIITIGLDNATTADFEYAQKSLDMIIAAFQAKNNSKEVTITKIDVPKRSIQNSNPRITVDLRNITDELIDRMEQEFEQYIQNLVDKSKIKILMEQKQRLAPVSFHTQIADLESEVIESFIEIKEKPKVTLGAGHDACDAVVARIPAGMIAVRNQFGSHNVLEQVKDEDIKLLSNVIVVILKKLADESFNIREWEKEAPIEHKLVQPKIFRYASLSSQSER